MTYVYECATDGRFERQEPIMQEHKANCSSCGRPARRVYTFQGMVYANPLFHPDGSYEDK